MMSYEQDSKDAQPAPGPAEVSSRAMIGSNRFTRAAGPPVVGLRETLSDTIRQIVLPRLIAARRTENDTQNPGRIRAGDIDLLLSHVSTADPALAEGLLASLARRGVPRADLLLELIAVVARRLADRWRRDECTFADVTLATGRLRRLIRSDSGPAAARPDSVGRILIAGLPGGQFSLGPAIIEDFFRLAGWDTVVWTGPDFEALAALAARAQPDVIGLLIEDGPPAAVRSLAARLRRPGAGVPLVGLCLDADPETQARERRDLGLDAVIPDARLAEPAVRALAKR